MVNFTTIVPIRKLIPFAKYCLCGFAIILFGLSVCHKVLQINCESEPNPRIIEYLKGLNKKVNAINTTVTISPSNVCKGADKDPDLLIIIPCTEKDFLQRETIRNTWASFRNKGNNTLPADVMCGITTGLVFIIATKTSSPSELKSVLEESESNGDMLLVDIEETYVNLIYKVFAGMRWMGENCRDTQYLLKADIDVYVHLPNLAPLLKINQGRDVVIGNVHQHSRVHRSGRSGITFKQYKFCNYLPYTEGNSYIITAKLVPKLLNAMQYIPIFHNEDAYLTGVLRSVLDAKIVHNTGFSKCITPIYQSNPERFYLVEKISETRCSVEIMKQFWSTWLTLIKQRDSRDSNTKLSFHEFLKIIFANIADLVTSNLICINFTRYLN